MGQPPPPFRSRPETETRPGSGRGGSNIWAKGYAFNVTPDVWDDLGWFRDRSWARRTAQRAHRHRQRDQHVAPHRFETVGIPLLRRHVIEPGIAQCREGRAVNRLVPKDVTVNDMTFAGWGLR